MTVSLDIPLISGPDDAFLYKYGSNWTFANNDGGNPVGFYSGYYSAAGCGMRFQSVLIPKNVIITAAYLKMTARDNISTNTVNSKITGDAEDSAAAFLTKVDMQNRRGTIAGGANNNYITVAQVLWNSIAGWTANTIYNSPDISAIIQEIVNRAGWNSGQAIALFWDDYDQRSTQSGTPWRVAYSYNNTPAKAPILHIEYSAVTQPTVTTQAASAITDTTATLNGNITDDGGGCSTRGFQYGLVSGSLNLDTHETGTFSNGAYNLPVTSLLPGKKYYFKAYASNGAGTGYGAELSFTTLYVSPTFTTYEDIFPISDVEWGSYVTPPTWSKVNSYDYEMLDGWVGGWNDDARCLFNFQSLILGVTIQKIVIMGTAQIHSFGVPGSGSGNYELLLKYGGANHVVGSGSGGPISPVTLLTNPATGLAWTVSDVNSIQAGVNPKATYAGDGQTVYGFWIRVYYIYSNTYNFLEPSLEIETVLGQTISTLRGTIYDPSASLTISPSSDLVQYDLSSGQKIFAGIVSYATGRTEGLSRYWDLICQSYTTLLDKSIVYAAYPAGFTYGGFSGDKAILADLFANRVVKAGGVLGASEITIGTDVVQGSTGLAAMNFFYMTLRECIELLAHYVGFSYYVDYDEKLHYYYQPTATAPYGLSSSPDNVTTLGYHNLRWKRDATQILNNFMVIGTQLTSGDITSIFGGNGVDQFWTYPQYGPAVMFGAPSGYTHPRVYLNTGTDLSPVWTELTVGTYPTEEKNKPPTGYNVAWDPTNNTYYYDVASTPPNFSNAIKMTYSIPINGGIPDSDATSIATYGRTFSTRLTASDANSAITILQNLANTKRQFKSALEVITLEIDSVDFPGTTRFAVGQYVSLVNAIMGINSSYWIHSIKSKVKGGTVSEYQLELRNWTLG